MLEAGWKCFGRLTWVGNPVWSATCKLGVTVGVVLTACDAQDPHWGRDSNLHLQDCWEDAGKTREGAWVELGWGLWCLVAGLEAP